MGDERDFNLSGGELPVMAKVGLRAVSCGYGNILKFILAVLTKFGYT